MAMNYEKLLRALKKNGYTEEKQLTVYALLESKYPNDAEFINAQVEIMVDAGLDETNAEDSFEGDVRLLATFYNSWKEVKEALNETAIRVRRENHEEFERETQKTADIMEAENYETTADMAKFMETAFYFEYLQNAVKKLEIKKFGSHENWFLKHYVPATLELENLDNFFACRLDILLTKYDSKNAMLADIKTYYVAEMQPLWDKAKFNEAIKAEANKRGLLNKTDEELFDDLRVHFANERKITIRKRMKWVTATAASLVVCLAVGLIVYFTSFVTPPPTYKQINELTAQEITTELMLQQKVAAEGATAITLNIDDFDFYYCEGYFDGANIVAYTVEYRNLNNHKIVMMVIFKDGYKSDINEYPYDTQAEPDSVNGVSITKRHFEDENQMLIKFAYQGNQIYMEFRPDDGVFSLSVVDAITK